MPDAKDPESARWNPIWLLLVALTGLVYARSGVPLPPAPAKSEPPAKTTKTAYLRPETKEDALVEVADEVHQLVAGGMAFDYLIALVPDPEIGATQTGWLFDSYADALERAMPYGADPADGLVFFRRFVPARWLEVEHPVSAADAPRQLPTPAPDEPGLLVFRSQGATPARSKLVALFLVGESPTRGVEPSEFRRVFDWLGYLDGGRWPTRRDYRIVGPTFSGSAWSLRHLIDALPPEITLGHRVHVVSGTATGTGLKRMLSVPGPVKTRFETTVIPDDDVIRAIYGHLGDLDVDLRKVAVLVESTTAYGELALNSTYLGRQGREAREIAAPRIIFQFPLHIAQARAAYEQTRRDRPEPGGVESRITQLELSLDQPTSPRDVLPPLDAAMTSIDVDLVLAGLLGTMAREDIRYVMILATDVRDKMFLARKLHQYLPDVRLITTESSILYTHPDYSPYLDGMIVGTTYPLLAKSQLWVLPRAVTDYLKVQKAARQSFTRTTRVAPFADSGAEGVYNATLALLGRRELMKDYGAPCFGSFCPSSTMTRPPIWLVAVSNGALWPIDIRTYEPGKSNAVLAAPMSSSPDPRGLDLAGSLSYSRFAATVFLVLSWLAAIQAWVVLEAWRPGSGYSSWRILEPFRPTATFRGKQQWWLLWLLIIVIGVEQVMAGLFGIFVASTWARHGSVEGARLATVVGAISLAVPLLALPAAIARVGGKVFGTVAAIFEFGVTVVCLGWTTWHLSPASAFFYIRATTFGSGVSPLVPLFCLALALYATCIHHLRRLYFRQCLAVENPLAAADVPYGRWLAAAEGTVARQVTDGLRAVPWQLWVPLGVVVAALPCFALWRSRVPGFEGVWFDDVFSLAFMLAYGAVLSACIRFAWLWVTVRAVLRHLDRHPMTAAFGRLPTNLRKELRRSFYAQLPGPTDRYQSFRMWLALRERYGSLRPLLDVSPEADFAAGPTEELAEFVDVEGSEPTDAGRDVFGARSKIQQLLSGKAKTLVGIILEQRRFRDGAPRAALRRWEAFVTRAEDFVAVQVAASLGEKFLQLRNLVSFCVFGVLLITFAFSSYPFQPHQLLALFSLTLTVAVVGVLLYAIVQADRDTLLSRMSGVAGGRITFDRGLVGQLVTYGVVPLITVLATQFPAAGDLFGSVLKLVR